MTKRKASVPEVDLVPLVRRAQAGEGDAFADLFHQLHRPVLNYTYRTLGDRQVAEDITRNVFVRAHERVGQLGPPWDFKTWIFRIASNLVIDDLRQGKRFVGVQEPWDMEDPPSMRRLDERAVRRGEAREAIEATLVLMPTRYCQALILREINDLGYGEVASALECSSDDARQLVHRARLTFRKMHGFRSMAESGAALPCELDDLLSAFRDDELSAEEQGRVRKHIAACEYCRETEKDLAKVAALVAGLAPIFPSPGWIEGVLKLIQSPQGPPTKPGGGQSPNRNRRG